MAGLTVSPKMQILHSGEVMRKCIHKKCKQRETGGRGKGEGGFEIQIGWKKTPKIQKTGAQILRFSWERKMTLDHLTAPRMEL